MIDLRPHFKHLHWRPMGHSMGVPVASDWADKGIDDPVFGLYKRCGLWTMDEANILHAVASRCNHGPWLDIGSHTAWTTCHIASAGVDVDAIDNMYAVPEFLERAERNSTNAGLLMDITFHAVTSNEYFQDWHHPNHKIAGAVVDGDHCSPHPCLDAVNAETHLMDTGVIIFHDFIGRPVQEGVEHLMDEGFKCRVYWTPHMVACCWRGDFVPPDHVRDPQINWDGVRAIMPRFPFERCA
jgi:hypothetical protein